MLACWNSARRPRQPLMQKSPSHSILSHLQVHHRVRRPGAHYTTEWGWCRCNSSRGNIRQQVASAVRDSGTSAALAEIGGGAARKASRRFVSIWANFDHGMGWKGSINALPIHKRKFVGRSRHQAGPGRPEKTASHVEHGASPFDKMIPQHAFPLFCQSRQYRAYVTKVGRRTFLRKDTKRRNDFTSDSKCSLRGLTPEPEYNRPDHLQPACLGCLENAPRKER
jgi:hypothetical protein